MSSRVRNLVGSHNSIDDEALWFRRLSTSVEGEAGRRELNSLSAERNPELLGASLLSFAGRQGKNRPAVAFEIYRKIAGNPEVYGSNQAELARRRLEALSGRGHFGARFELFAQHFVEEASDPAALAGMAVAGGVFQGLHLAAYARLLASPTANLFTRGLGARGLAFGLGFAAEAPAFSTTVHALHAALGRNRESGFSFGQELASGYLMLGALRFSGAASGALSRTVNPASALTGNLQRRFFEQGSMLGGIAAAHWLETQVGLRHRQAPDDLLADSLATLLHFNVAGRLLHGIGGNRLSQELGLRGASLDNPSFHFPSVPRPLTLASAASPIDPSILAMSSGIKTGQGPQNLLNLAVGNSSDRSNAPVNRNSRIYLRLREAMGEKEMEIFRLLSELNSSGSPLWIETALQASRFLAENLQADLPRIGGAHAVAQERILRKLIELQAGLDLVRRSEQPAPMDEDARKLLGHLYRVPNQFINYLNSGEIHSLEGTLRSASAAVDSFRRDFLSRHVVNPDSGELSVESLPPNRGLRVIQTNERHSREEPSPFYEFVDDSVFVVDVPPFPNYRVLLLGEIPKERGALAERHRVTVGEADRQVHRDLMAEAINWNIEARIPRLNREYAEGFDYVEAYNAFDAPTLLSESGRASLENNFFRRIRPGGIGLWMSRDPRSMELAVQTALDRELADVIVGAYGGESPLSLPAETNRSLNNFVFFRRLPNK